MLIHQSIYDGVNFCLNKIKHSYSANDINIALHSQEVHKFYIANFVREMPTSAVNYYTVVL